MWTLFKKLLKDISTGVDGESYDCIRLYTHFAVIAYIGLCISDFVIAHQFNYTAFGTGFAAIVAGSGVGIMAKKETEPKASE
jgi:hypothetical protein